MVPIEPKQFDIGIPMLTKCPKCGKDRIKAFNDMKLREMGYLQLRYLDCGTNDSKEEILVHIFENE